MSVAVGEVISERMMIRVDSRALECRLHYPSRGRPGRAALVAPPHPWLGGNLDNNVVVRLAGEFASAGMLAVTWNPPGVGGSAPRGERSSSRANFWDDPEIGDEAREDASDIATIIEAANDALGREAALPLLSGYSHGAAVIALASARTDACGLFLVSPPLPRMPADAFQTGDRPLRIVFGEDDIACDAETRERFERESAGPADVHVLKGGDHFHLDHLDDLADLARDFIARVTVGTTRGEQHESNRDQAIPAGPSASNR